MGQAHRAHIIAKRQAPAHRLGSQAKIDPKDWRTKSSAKVQRAKANWIDRVVNRIEA